MWATILLTSLEMSSLPSLAACCLLGILAIALAADALRSVSTVPGSNSATPNKKPTWSLFTRTPKTWTKTRSKNKGFATYLLMLSMIGGCVFGSYGLFCFCMFLLGF